MTEFDIIQMPIGFLGFSHVFEYQCKEMGFSTLEDILVLSSDELMGRKGFSYHWLGELSAFLTRHDLLHLLQPRPGRKFW